MAGTLHVAWDERLTDYHFGPDHPLASVRVELTMRLAHEFGLWRSWAPTMGSRCLRSASGLRRRELDRDGGIRAEQV
jgi:acetoin utilization protein AcuC